MTNGGRTEAVHGGRCRHTVWGAETSGGDWRVVGVGEAQVEDVPHRDKRWGADIIYIEVIRRRMVDDGGGGSME